MDVINLHCILSFFPFLSAVLVFIVKIYIEHTKRKIIDIESEKFKLSKETELKINEQNNKAAIRIAEINAQIEQRKIVRAS